MANVKVGRKMFGEALAALAAMSPTDREVERSRVNAKVGRSYFARNEGDPISLKLVLRKAYVDAGIGLDDVPYSKDVYSAFHHEFDLVHRPGADEAIIRDETREREYVSRLKRKGQAKFRSLLIAKNPQCALSGCSVLPTLEAAHICPVARKGRDTSSNGILLRADLHRLFDADLLAVSPTDGSWHLHPCCVPSYSALLKGSARQGFDALSRFAERWAGFTKQLERAHP